MSQDYKVGEALFYSAGQWYKKSVPYVGDCDGRLVAFSSENEESGEFFHVLGVGSDPIFNSIHPVQILTWSSFEESKHQKSFVDYVLLNKSTLTFLSIDEKVLGLGISDDILVLDEQTGLYISGVSLVHDQVIANRKGLSSELVPNEKNTTPRRRLFTFDCSKLKYEDASTIHSAFSEKEPTVGNISIQIDSIIAQFVVTVTRDPQAIGAFITTHFSKPLDSILLSLSLVKKDATDFNKEFECKGDISREYLLARIFYSQTSQLFRKQLDISSYLNQLQSNHGINLGKDDLTHFPTLMLSSTKCSLAEDVAQYGKDHQWQTAVPSNVYTILWNASADMQSDAEINFLTKDLFPYVRRCGFIYSLQDIIRFHTSVKCGMLTLLGGGPGTGKSSLVELYFRALGGHEKNKNEPETFCRIDVNPSWMEPADLLGYKDANGKFQPAGNGFYEFLSGTATHPDGTTSSDNDADSLRPVCLEEINLACAEHYFSDFIQIISREGGKMSVAGAGNPVVVDKRTRFVGTCNSDETTHSMSQRLLDRCNYIELGMGEETLKTLYEKCLSGQPAKPLPFTKGEGVPSTVYNSWCCINSEKVMSKDITDAFSALFPHFEAAGIAPSPRVVSDITTYIRNRPPLDNNGDRIPEDLDENRQQLAFDECVAQRILSKYRAAPGTVSAWKDIKDKLGNYMTLSKGIVEVKLQEYKQMTSFASL